MRLQIDHDQKTVEVVLSHRNLAALLAKLEGAPADSALTITKNEPDPEGGRTWLVTVKAETDQTHYQDRPYPPGEAHPETERLIVMLRPGWSRRALD